MANPSSPRDPHRLTRGSPPDHVRLPVEKAVAFCEEQEYKMVFVHAKTHAGCAAPHIVTPASALRSHFSGRYIF